MSKSGKMPSVDLKNENIEELESIGKLNIKFLRKEGQKFLLVGLMILAGDIIGFWLIVTYSDLMDNEFFGIIFMIFVVIFLGAGIVNLYKGLLKFILSPPKAPKEIDNLIKSFYKTLIDEITTKMGAAGIAISWLDAYVCLTKNDRDKIGPYVDFVNHQKELAKKITSELLSLIKSKLPKMSTVEYQDYNIERLNVTNNIETYKVEFLMNIYKGIRGSSLETFKQIGIVVVTETITVCILNNRYYMVNYNWSGVPKLVGSIEGPNEERNPSETFDHEENASMKPKNKLTTLHNLITFPDESFFGNSNKELIVEELNKLCSSKEEAEYLILEYQKYFKKDIIQELMSLTTSYDGLKQYLAPFIDLNILEPQYPHEKLN